MRARDQDRRSPDRGRRRLISRLRPLATAWVAAGTASSPPWSEELTGDARYELVAGLPVRLMAPTNIRHAQIRYNAGQAFRRSIGEAGLHCRVYDAGPGLAVGHEGDECRIPDVVVPCAATIDEAARLVPEPVIVVEVASPSTRLADVKDKVEFYGGIASVRHHLVIEQDRRRVVYQGRGPSGGLEPRILREGEIALHPPNVRFALDALYRDTEPAAT